MEDVCVYPDEAERQSIFKYLDALPVEYHKEYQRFNKTVKVPRGQASYTLTPEIHYDYKVSGGSPPNEVMCEQLKAITKRVNEKLGTGFNTILLNKYKDGDDCIGYHRDRETGWVEGTGFATLCFGAERDFQVKHEASGVVDTVLHRDGHVLYMPYPMNQECLHGVPKRKKVNGCRISLTFREIAS
eukprot:COSAG04_NODE_834_length_9992_cov_54.919786_7_plen_186_part_00